MAVTLPIQNALFILQAEEIRAVTGSESEELQFDFEQWEIKMVSDSYD